MAAAAADQAEAEARGQYEAEMAAAAEGESAAAEAAAEDAEFSHFLEGEDPHKTAIVPAVESMLAIRDDLNGRIGFDLGSLDDDVQNEILEGWVRIIEPKARAYARQIAREALGLFWAQKFPADVLPTDEMMAAVDAVLPPSAKP